MDIADCYRVLGLREGASFRDIKASYRRLVRLYHPDVSGGDASGDSATARRTQEKFIQVTEAYKFLLSVIPPEEKAPPPVSVQTNPSPPKSEVKPDSATPKVKVTRKPQPVEFVTPLSEADKTLKNNVYLQLQQFLKLRNFPRAIALVEALAQRLPQDLEVKQWQAIAYQQWGRHLTREKQVEKARIYLKKALKTDPHNRSLWAEVERDFQTLEKIY